MEVLEAFVQSLTYFANPEFSLAMVGGVVIGLIIGIIPGVGGIFANSIILCFVYRMTALQALPLMVAITSIAVTGGSITAILLNIPGESANAATLLDGFPMAKKGEAGRAIGAALAASGLGGIAGVALAFGIIPLILPLIKAVKSGDMVFVIVMGLSFIAVLGSGSMVKGLVSGGIGLLAAFVGYQMETGIPRFTLGNMYLYEGLHVVPVALGLFGVPEMITLAVEGGTIAKTGVAVKGMSDVLEGVKDVFRHWLIWLRSTVIGYVVGVIPGIGGMTAIWVAYGQAKQTSKHPELFGTGIVEGVIAPESSNNAKLGGDLLTTFALGLPGSAGMTIILGALLLMGFTPGPEMMKTNLDLSFSLLLVAAVANVLASGICLPMAVPLAKIALIPGRILVPIIIVITLVGTFATRGYVIDLAVLFLFSVVGLAMKLCDFNRPSLILGFVLGGLFEKYFFMALGLHGPLFFMTPISLTIIVLLIAVFALGPIKKLAGRWKARAR